MQAAEGKSKLDVDECVWIPQKGMMRAIQNLHY